MNQHHPNPSLLHFRDRRMIAVFRRRELKWLQMLDDWEKYMTYKYKKVCNFQSFVLVVSANGIHSIGERQMQKRNS